MIDSLLFAAMFGLVLLYVPGFLMNKAFHFDSLLSFIVAPMVSCLLMVVIGPILYWIPVSLNGIVLFACMTTISLIALLFSALNYRKRNAQIAQSANIMSRLPRSMTMFSMMGVQNKFSNWAMLLLYVIAAICMTIYMFLGNIDLAGSASFLPEESGTLYDISVLTQTGVFSCIIGSLPTETGELVIGFNSLGQIIPAIIANATNVDYVTSFNAMLILLCIFIVPLGFFSLLSVVFYKNRLLVASGAIFAVSFGAFPWDMLLSYDQGGSLISLAFVPYTLVAILGLTIQKSNRHSKLAYLFLILAAVVSIIASCANMLLVIFVMCIPYMISRYFSWVNDFGKFDNAVLAKIMGVIACIATFLLLWASCCNIPIRMPEVAIPCLVTDGLLNAIANIFALALIPTAGSQLVLGVMTVCGALIMLFRRGYRWIVSTWAICVLMYLMSALFPQETLIYAFGFWYVGLSKISSLVCIASVPLIAAFASITIRAFTNAICAYANVNQSKGLLVVVGCVFLVCFASANLLIKSTTYFDDQSSGNSIHVVKDAIHTRYEKFNETPFSDAEVASSSADSVSSKKATDSENNVNRKKSSKSKK